MNDPQNSRKPASPRRSRWLEPFAFALSAWITSGCDIVQGFQSAGDTLFPEEATHLSTPGVRVVSGGYRDLRFATGGELFVLARSPDDGFVHLHAMRYSRPEPCTIPNVARFATTQDPSRRAALIAYFEVDARVSTLRFADTTCNSYDMQLPNATLPLLEIPRGFVVRTDDDIRVVDPQAGVDELIAADADAFARDLFAGRHVIRSVGKLKVFDQDWALQGIFGESVRNFWRLRQSLVYEDGPNIQRLSVSTSNAQMVEESRVVEDACALSVPSDTWAIFRSPCDSTKLHAYHERTRKIFPLPMEADPYYLLMYPAKDSPGEDLTKDPFWFFYLRDVDGNTGLGTLFVRTRDDREIELGKRAPLPNVSVIEGASGTYGYALVDVDDVTRAGTLLWWAPDGTTRELARGVRRDGKRTVMDFDGTSGTLAVVSGDRVSVVAERVPDRFEFPDEEGRWTALFNDSDGKTAKLSVLNGVLDTLEDTPLDRPIPQVSLEDVTERIPLVNPGLLNRVLPGLAYYQDYDEQRRVGTLVYRNLELKFTALLNYGVSDFVVAEDEVIYSIPYGDSAGIWVVQGK